MFDVYLNENNKIDDFCFNASDNEKNAFAKNFSLLMTNLIWALKNMIAIRRLTNNKQQFVVW